MYTSWYQKAQQFKSPSRVLAAVFLRSRETQAANYQRLKAEKEELQRQLELAKQQVDQLRKQVDSQKQEIQQLKRQRDEAAAKVNLPPDPPLGTHGYGARMISLAANLARRIGLRSAQRALKTFFQWLDLKQRTPSRTSIRNWLQRLGVAEMKQPLACHEDLVVLIDHSCQMGAEKVMVALGVNASTMPEPGQPLRHQDVRVLEVKPSSQWKTEDMEQEYLSLAEQYGPPRAVLADGATELQEGAKCLKKQRSDTIVLGDFKHYAANEMKSLLGKQESFQQVAGKMGSTRAAIQQTELAHLTPPTLKQKARYMNLSSKIRWLSMIVWLLKTPHAKARQGIDGERIEAKLGWVRDYAADIPMWRECQRIVSIAVSFINKQGVFQGASIELRKAIGRSLKYETSRELAKRLVAYVRKAEKQLRKGERLPMSTEILESSFGLYKNLERQHSKSGFTSLLACFPALLKPTTASMVKEAFARVSPTDVQVWIDKHFASTVHSRRCSAYSEYKSAQNRATTRTATT